MQFFSAFGVDWVKLGLQILNFLVILYLLNRFAFKPLIRFMDERSARIEKGLEDAEAAERDRALAQAEREAALAESRKEAQALVARANKIAEDSRNEILADARTQAEKLVEHAREEINAEKEKAMAELRTTVADLALEAAGKLVRSEMSGAKQRRLVDDFLAEADSGSGRARRN